MSIGVVAEPRATETPEVFLPNSITTYAIMFYNNHKSEKSRVLTPPEFCYAQDLDVFDLTPQRGTGGPAW